MKTKYGDAEAFVTKDGSIIRELMHPAAHSETHGVKLQSLAEATVPVGIRTLLHCHKNTEELYHITAGQGRMTLGEKQVDVRAGDTLCITPGTAHCIENTGGVELKLLCCCAPAYSHGDTQLLD